MKLKKETVFRYKPLYEVDCEYNDKDLESLQIVTELIIKKIESNNLNTENQLTT
jgi:hypothetical protein